MFGGGGGCSIWRNGRKEVEEGGIEWRAIVGEHGGCDGV